LQRRLPQQQRRDGLSGLRVRALLLFSGWINTPERRASGTRELKKGHQINVSLSQHQKKKPIFAKLACFSRNKLNFARISLFLQN
jgi:hypothetical protein